MTKNKYMACKVWRKSVEIEQIRGCMIYAEMIEEFSYRDSYDYAGIGTGERRVYEAYAEYSEGCDW